MAERFKVHKMIESFTTGEDIDVDFLKELIAKDSLVDDLTMHIEDTKEDKILTYRECVNLLNENEQLKKENEDLNEELMEYDSFVLLYKEQRDELKKENEVLKSTEMEYEDALGRLEEENEKLKNDGLSFIFAHYLNDTLKKDIKTLLFILAFCELQKTTRLSPNDFKVIERLQGFLCENIIDLDKLKRSVKNE